MTAADPHFSENPGRITQVDVLARHPLPALVAARDPERPNDVVLGFTGGPQELAVGAHHGNGPGTVRLWEVNASREMQARDRRQGAAAGGAARPVVRQHHIGRKSAAAVTGADPHDRPRHRQAVSDAALNKTREVVEGVIAGGVANPAPRRVHRVAAQNVGRAVTEEQRPHRRPFGPHAVDSAVPSKPTSRLSQLGARTQCERPYRVRLLRRYRAHRPHPNPQRAPVRPQATRGPVVAQHRMHDVGRRRALQFGDHRRGAHCLHRLRAAPIGVRRRSPNEIAHIAVHRHIRRREIVPPDQRARRRLPARGAVRGPLPSPRQTRDRLPVAVQTCDHRHPHPRIVIRQHQRLSLIHIGHRDGERQRVVGLRRVLVAARRVLAVGDLVQHRVAAAGLEIDHRARPHRDLARSSIQAEVLVERGQVLRRVAVGRGRHRIGERVAVGVGGGDRRPDIARRRVLRHRAGSVRSGSPPSKDWGWRRVPSRWNRRRCPGRTRTRPGSSQ